MKEEVEGQDQENESEYFLNFRLVKDRLVNISKLVIDGKREDKMRACFLLGRLITEMEIILEDIENQKEKKQG